MKNAIGQVILIMLMSYSAMAQHTLDRDYTEQLVKTIAKTYAEYYTFPAKGKEVAKLLLSNLKKEQYLNMANYASLASKLKRDIYEVTKDKHAQVIYKDPTKSPDGKVQQPNVNEFFKSIENYGFNDIKIIYKTIGYVKMPIFFPIRMDAKATDAADAMMKKFKHCTGIIFDLRECRGGDPAMISYLISYLYPKGEKVHLNDFYYRPEDATTSSYTGNIKGQAMPDIDVYVLTSGKTFSAGEEFAYDLKHLRRAKLIGETTGGGAHTVEHRLLDEQFELMVPTGRAVNPITKTNWEGVGVKPHIEVMAKKALDIAIKKIMDGS